MVCRNLSAFADAPRAGSAEAKGIRTTGGWPTADAPRAGSAEAKCGKREDSQGAAAMHPVQAAPRQRPRKNIVVRSTA